MISLNFLFYLDSLFYIGSQFFTVLNKVLLILIQILSSESLLYFNEVVQGQKNEVNSLRFSD